MTELEWHRSINPAELIRFAAHSGRATERTLMLFGVRCCRLLWPLFPDNLRHAVKQVEAFADGAIDRPTLDRVSVPWARRSEPEADRRTNSVCHTLLVGNLYVSTADRMCAVADQLSRAVTAAQRPPRPPLTGDEGYDEYDLDTEPDESAVYQQVLLAFDVFGNPLRSPQLDPSWLTPTVVALAQLAYKERSFGRLPILADALEEAGCADDDILSHCREDGPHARGCWVLDLLLGKR